MGERLAPAPARGGFRWRHLNSSLLNTLKVLIGFIPLVDIFGMPLVGMVSLGLILYNLVARIRLPGNAPGVLVAIAAGATLYHLLGPSGLLGGTYAPPVAELHLGLPTPTFGFLKGLVPALPSIPMLEMPATKEVEVEEVA